MEITILNTGEDNDEFHELAAGELGSTIRKAGKDYIGSKNLSENQLREMQQNDEQAFTQLEEEMTRHALEVAKVSHNTSVALRLNLDGSKQP
ncbi:hypothetical protein [Halomonas sp. M20]|uniref:hypothetical protein n=1 Tax=Halomonas sp. M20 TaxID=2763264 RepID=UPI001D0A5B55|nr:hypothetical protein [Halomonas sp. M20]